jgi:hypothetical protein
MVRRATARERLEVMNVSKFNVDLTLRGKQERTYAGRTYHSKKEAQYAAILDLRQRAGEIREWEAQVRIPLRVNGVIVTH